MIPTETAIPVIVLFAGLILHKYNGGDKNDLRMSYSEVERAILIHLYRRGDDRPANISDHQGVHQNSVSRTAPDLIDAGLIINKGHGVYQLTDKGTDIAQRLAEIDDLSEEGEDG